MIGIKLQYTCTCTIMCIQVYHWPVQTDTILCTNTVQSLPCWEIEQSRTNSCDPHSNLLLLKVYNCSYCTLLWQHTYYVVMHMQFEIITLLIGPTHLCTCTLVATRIGNWHQWGSIWMTMDYYIPFALFNLDNCDPSCKSYTLLTVSIASQFFPQYKWFLYSYM